MTEFESFWAQYPRRIAKFAAARAFVKARQHASLETILDGVAAYILHKPSYADYAHPATWLHQGRWLDEWDTAQKRGLAEQYHAPDEGDYDWFQQCRELHDRRCNGRDGHRIQMLIDEARAAERAPRGRTA